MTNSWPPTMHAPSKDLKRCLGDEKMSTRTMWKKLKDLGYPNQRGLILTEDFIDRVAKKQKDQVLPTFEKYSPKTDAAKKFLENA